MEQRYINTNIAFLYDWINNQEKKIPIRFVLIKENEYYNLFDLLENEKDKDYSKYITSCITLYDIMMSLYHISKNKNKSLLKTINKQLETQSLKTFVNIEELEKEYKKWYKDLKKEIEDNSDKNLIIQNSLEYFEKFKDSNKFVFNTNFIIEASELTYNTEIENINDGYAIFDKIKSNNKIPLIKYIDKDGKDFYKIYKDFELIDQKSKEVFENIIDEFNKYNNNNLIYIKLFLENEVYITLKLNIENNFLTIDNIIDYVDYTEEIKSVLKSNLNLKLTNPKIMNIRGHFELWDKELDINVFDFLHYILLDDIASEFFYIKEETKYFGQKVRMDLHYNKLFERYNVFTLYNNSDVGFNFNLKNNKENKKIKGINPHNNENIEKMVKKGERYYKVNINGVHDINDIKDFIYVLQSILFHYNNNQKAISEIYESLGKNHDKVSDSTLSFEEMKVVKRSENTILSRLKERTKEYGLIPSKGYARKVTGRLYPSLILPEEFDNIDPDKQIMRFPEIFPPNRKLYFYLKDNYPVFFFEEDGFPEEYYEFNLKLPPPNEVPGRLYYQITDDNIKFSYKKKEGYKKYKEDFPPKQLYFYCENEEGPYPGVMLNVKENKNKFPYLPNCYKQDQLNNENSIYNQYFNKGKIPSDIKESTNKKEIIKSSGKILDPDRKGLLPETLQNLVQLLSSGTQGYRYGVIRSKSSLLHCVLSFIQDKKYMKFTSNFDREDYVNQIRESLYDKVYPELMKQELYDIEYEEDLENKEVYLDPSKYYRALEELYNVNIYVFNPLKVKQNEKSSNVEKAVLKLPRYQTFHSRPVRKDRETIMIYEHYGSDTQGFEDYPQCEYIDIEPFPEKENIAKLCHDVLKNTLTTITNIEGGNHLNLYYNNDILSYLPLQLIDQFIDSKGKMVGVNGIFGKDIYMTICFLPSQPLNLPLAENYFELDIKEVDKIFINKPTSKNKNKGLWFAYKGIDNLFYVPTKGKIKYKLLEGNDNPLNKIVNKNSNEEVVKYRIMSIIMKTLINWLFVLSDMELEDFFENVKLNEKVLYNFKDIEYKLPLVNYQQALDYLQEKTENTLVKKGQIYIRDQNMLDKLKYNTQNWLNNFKSGEIVIPKIIEDYYTDINSFDKDDKVLIFDNKDTFKDWYKSSRDFNSIYKIHKIIGNPHSTLINPFIFKRKEGYYLISNTGEDKKSAIYSTLNWNRYKLNSDKEIEYTTKDYVVYTLENGDIYEDIDPNKPGIIKYKITDLITKYASLLPL